MQKPPPSCNDTDVCAQIGSDIMKSTPEPTITSGKKGELQNTPKRRRKSGTKKSRTKNLLSATNSAIDRLEQITRPGGDIESMDIRDLKNVISSIKELTAVQAELSEENSATGGVIVLPEVNLNE